MPEVMTGKPFNISGSVHVHAKCASDSELPADPKVDLSTDFKSLGYISEDGTENGNELNVTNVKCWGGLIVYSSLNEQTDTFKLTLIESTNEDVLKTVYGDKNVVEDASGNKVINVVADDPQRKMFVIELALKNGKRKRIVIPDGAVTARETIRYKDDTVIGYGITITAYPYEFAGNGAANNTDKTVATHREYIEA